MPVTHALAVLFAVLVTFAAEAQPLPRTVLLIDEVTQLHPWFRQLTASFTATLKAEATSNVYVHVENLDLYRFGTEKYPALLKSHFHEKYRGQAIGVIVVHSTGAMPYALRLRDELWPDTPVILAGVHEGAVARDKLHTHLMLKAEHERAERLLLNVLPVSIAERLKHDHATIADAAEAVSVVFADLVGFTPLAAGRPPAEVVRLLDAIFRAFDECAAAAGVEKIKTVGDAYLAVAGLPEARADHAAAAARFALALRESLAVYSAAEGLVLRVRIGIESGPVVAGVIGKHKFSYDLWGDTVNAAARMESHGEPDRIQVGESAARLLEKDFMLEARGEIQVKGKGRMRTWWLTASRS